MSKVLNALMKKHSDKIEEWFYEGVDGYWIILRPGWSQWGEVHAVHEWTVKDAVAAFNSGVRPCDCDDCKAELAKLAK